MKKEVIKERIDERTKKSLAYSTKDGIAATVTVNTGDNFISPYAVALNATNLQIGLLSALPNLIPIELLTTRLMSTGKMSRKQISLLGVLIQIIMLALIASLGLFAFKNSMIAPTLLIVLFTLYAAGGLFGSPAWASWMKDLTENIEMGKYFGNRNRIFGIIGLIAVIIAGFALDSFKKAGLVFLGFALLFLIAAISRTISRYFMSKQHEPKLKIKKESFFSFWQFIKKSPTNNYGRFVIFIALINFSVMISGPFFSPYMLEVLKFNYITYVFINLIISTTATLVTMPLWGRFLDRYGCVKTMKITVWALPFIPILWLVSQSSYWLFFIQILSGVAWAGFNLAAGTFTYEAVTKERMNLCIAYSSIFNGVAIFLGATLGGLIASLNITFMNIFLFVFLVSGIARIIVIGTMFHSIKEVRQVRSPKPLLKLILRPLQDLDFMSSFSNLIHPRSKKKR